MQILISCAFALWVSIGITIGYILTYPTKSETVAEKFELYLEIFRSRHPRWTDQRVWKIAEYYATYEQALIVGISAIFWPIVLVQVWRFCGRSL
jgi:hypothetical protein